MILDKNLVKYIKDKKSFLPIAIALALGILLWCLGSTNETEEVSAVGMEERLAEICSGVEGVGECEILIYYSKTDTRGDAAVESVLVICDGADSVDVRARLTAMLSSFFGIGTNRIRVECRAK